MAELYLIPQWFFSLGVTLEILFAIITAALAIASFRIYKLSGQRECNLFGLGFTFVSLAYLSWAIVNLSFASIVSNSARGLSLDRLTALGSTGVYIYAFFTILGFATLAYTTLPQGNARIYSLLAGLSLIVLVFAQQKAVAFYFVSSLLLFFVVLHYTMTFFSKKRIMSFLVLLGFLFVFLGNVNFIFSAVRQVHYVAGHALQLIGYSLMLISLFLTLRK